MKKLFMSFCAVVVLISASAFSGKPVGKGDLKASEILMPVGNKGQTISLLELSTISRGDLESLTGKKMNFTQKLAFKGAQKKLRNSINNDGYVTDKKVKKFFKADGGSGFHLGGFALGFFLGLIGVIVAYVLNDDLKSQRVKWAWIGLGAAIVLSLIVIVAIL